MQYNHPTTPLIPIASENNKQFLMQVDNEIYHPDANGELGVLTLDTFAPLLSVSEDANLLASGETDRSDSVAPNVYLAALFLTRQGFPVLKAICSTTKAASAKFIEPSRPAKLGHWCKVLDCRLPFKLEFQIEETIEQLEFEVDINGKLYLETGRIMVSAGSNVPGKEPRILKQSVWCIKNQPLFGYKPAGFELLAHRINYNRRIQA